MFHHVCKVCGKEFTSSQPTTKGCTVACKTKWSMILRKKRKKLVRLMRMPCYIKSEYGAGSECDSCALRHICIRKTKEDFVRWLHDYKS